MDMIEGTIVYSRVEEARLRVLGGVGRVALAVVGCGLGPWGFEKRPWPVGELGLPVSDTRKVQNTGGNTSTSTLLLYSILAKPSI